MSSSRLLIVRFGLRLAGMVVAVLLIFPLAVQAATPVTFWTTEVSPDRQAVIQYLVQAFMVFNPDINVRVVGVEENSMVGALSRARREGRGPDVVGCASNQIVAFCKLGWMDADGALKVIRAIGEDRFYSGPLKRLQRSDGSFCGIPFNGWVQGIWYRRDWFEEAGLAPPDNWASILKAAKALHSPKDGRYGILLGTKGDNYSEQVFTHLALSAGVHEFSSSGEVVFDSHAAVETLKLYAELANYTPPGPQGWRGRDYYLQGRLAMMFYSTFIMDDLAIPSIAMNSLTGSNFEDLDGAPFDIHLLGRTGMVASITGTREATYGVVHALGLVKSRDEVRNEAVRRFVRFLFQDDAYITWLHMVPGGMLPVLRDTANNAAFYRDAQGVFHKYSRQRLRGILAGFDTLQSFEFINGELLPEAALVSAQGVIGKMIEGVVVGKKDPATAVKEAAESMRTIAEEQH